MENLNKSSTTLGLELNYRENLENMELLNCCESYLNNDCLEIISNMYEVRFKKERLEYTRNLEEVEKIYRWYNRGNLPKSLGLLKLEIHFELYNFLQVIKLEETNNVFPPDNWDYTYLDNNILKINPVRKKNYNLTAIGFK